MRLLLWDVRGRGFGGVFRVRISHVYVSYETASRDSRDRGYHVLGKGGNDDPSPFCRETKLVVLLLLLQKRGCVGSMALGMHVGV